MAESEQTHSQVDEGGEDEFFKNVGEFFAATSSKQQENITVETNKEAGSKSIGEDVREGITCSADPGFHDTDVVVIEGKTLKGNISLGTGILLQDPGTWGKIDTRPRRFVLTAAHCVCGCGHKVHVFPEIRIRIPKKPWINFPQDKKEYPSNMRVKHEAYKSILINDTSKQVFIHPKYDGIWTGGADIALIAIPEVIPSNAGARKIFDIWQVNLGSLWWKTENRATSCTIVGFPYKGKFSHYPYFSSTKGDDIVEFYKNGSMARYYSKTSGGMSGGSIEFDNKIIGVHNAGDEMDGYSNGSLFTKSLRYWMQQIFVKWGKLFYEKTKIVNRPGEETEVNVVLFHNGLVQCSGDKQYGGDPGSKQCQLNDIESIASTDWACAAIKRNGRVIAWGSADNGGDPGSKQSQLTGVESIASTNWAFAALKRDGTVVTWGTSYWGGDPGSKQSQLTNVESIASNGWAFAALKRDGTVVTWGSGCWGGNSDSKQLVDIILIGSANKSFAAMTRDGNIICWGEEEDFSLATKNCKRLKLMQGSKPTRI